MKAKLLNPLAAALPHNPHRINHRTKSNIVSIVEVTHYSKPNNQAEAASKKCSLRSTCTSDILLLTSYIGNGPCPIHDVVVTAVSAAVSAATIILASMSKILFLSISKIEN